MAIAENSIWFRFAEYTIQQLLPLASHKTKAERGELVGDVML